MDKISVLFRSLATRSMDRAFLIDSISRQITVAKAVRVADNHDRILFDQDFHPTAYKLIAGHRIAINNLGEEAILLASQRVLTPEYYYRFIAPDATIIYTLNRMIIKAIHGPSTLLLTPTDPPN